ncbi:MAG: TrkH family potassium uptake protein [Bacteroidaceae bacterium]|nr:TrkH family potassium uptake protein [Bacteroidaceae bacterium]MBO7347225.1 TrkH family potassium uptake protein [Bacteroidaceae bacterium]
MEGVFLLLTMIVSLIYEESDWWAYLLSASISFVIGRICIWLSRMDKDNRSFTRADSFMIVTLSWVIFSVIGMIPFILIEKMDLASAFFETMSGFTTTGATVITDIDSMTHALRFWRSLTQWMGGLGIVVFSFALIPVSEMKNNNIFSAEVTGIGLDKIRPKIGSTARRLLIIYLILTLICTGLYYVGPMNIYDAVCHSLSTIATGGFSTHSESIAYFHSSYIEYICAVFMILSSINFSLFYYASMRKWHVLKQNEEVKVFLTVVLCMTGFFFFLFCFSHSHDDFSILPLSLEEKFRTSFFHVATVISSTGFSAQKFDYVAWGDQYWMPTVVIMAVGACAGSTAGGMKIIRAIICAKSVRNEFIRQMHPNAVLGVRINGNIISDSRVKHSLGFLFLYIAMVVIGMTILTYIGLDVDTGLGACISSLSNVGPGTGECGPSGTFAHVPALGKWLLSFYMLVGRLEIYTVLFLFMPIFFKGTK